MITTLLLYFINGAIILATYPLRLLADAELPVEIYNTISQVGGYLGAIEPVFPINTLLTILGLLLAIEGYIFIYKVVMWIIRRIPTQS